MHRLAIRPHVPPGRRALRHGHSRNYENVVRRPPSHGGFTDLVVNPGFSVHRAVENHHRSVEGFANGELVHRGARSSTDSSTIGPHVNHRRDQRREPRLTDFTAPTTPSDYPSQSTSKKMGHVDNSIRAVIRMTRSGNRRERGDETGLRLWFDDQPATTGRGFARGT